MYVDQRLVYGLKEPLPEFSLDLVNKAEGTLPVKIKDFSGEVPKIHDDNIFSLEYDLRQEFRFCNIARMAEIPDPNDLTNDHETTIYDGLISGVVGALKANEVLAGYKIEEFVVIDLYAGWLKNNRRWTDAWHTDGSKITGILPILGTTTDIIHERIKSNVDVNEHHIADVCMSPEKYLGYKPLEKNVFSIFSSSTLHRRIPIERPQNRANILVFIK